MENTELWHILSQYNIYILLKSFTSIFLIHPFSLSICSMQADTACTPKWSTVDQNWTGVYSWWSTYDGETISNSCMIMSIKLGKATSSQTKIYLNMKILSRENILFHSSVNTSFLKTKKSKIYLKMKILSRENMPFHSSVNTSCSYIMGPLSNIPHSPSVYITYSSLTHRPDIYTHLWSQRRHSPRSTPGCSRQSSLCDEPEPDSGHPRRRTLERNPQSRGCKVNLCMESEEMYFFYTRIQQLIKQCS